MKLPPPQWLHDFTDEIGACLHTLDEPSLGCHFHFADEVWEVTLFFAATEVVGGAFDGVRTQPTFWLDVRQLFSVMDVDQMHWQSQAVNSDDDLAAHVSVTGQYHGKSIWLRVLANSPAAMPPGQTTESSRGDMLPIW
ncbi:MAG: hypothetical protein R3C18_18455 [Planctomycetaceae bacterium]